MRQEVDKFNQEFWTRNNTMFMEAKEAYERQRKSPVDLSGFFFHFTQIWI